MNISECVNWLVEYGIKYSLIEKEDVVFTKNTLLEALSLDELTCDGTGDINISTDNLDDVLNVILDFAADQKLIPENTVTYRDLFDTKIMGLITPRPSVVIREFNRLKNEDVKRATDYFYNLSRVTNYIRTNRVKKDMKWKTPSEFGDMDITINLSKPEKDPKAIAAALKMKQVSYPKCQLCVENEGYAGRTNHPARQNLRIVPFTINNESWGMQYSPYVYYNEHCIVLNHEHTPMKINRATFVKLLDFVDLFPHYILGSNADLPIVGGSILTHDHFQGGNYEFPMAKAETEIKISFEGFKDIDAEIVKWPMSVIRLTCKNKERLIELSDKILNAWRNYSDRDNFIFAETGGEKHNTITPIARKRGDLFQIDLVLRNNITTPEHPLGVYHPHAALHHIKKENIGLIEVMGYAILPSRLKKELTLIREALINGKSIDDEPGLESHKAWFNELKNKYDSFTEENTDEIIKKEVGLIFVEVLKDAGVYKCGEKGRKAFLKFIDCVNKK